MRRKIERWVLRVLSNLSRFPMSRMQADVLYETLTAEILAVAGTEVELACTVARSLNETSDFVDFINLPDGGLGIAVGCAKRDFGAEALAEEVGRCIREAAMEGCDAERVISSAHAELKETISTGSDVAIFYGALDARSRSVTFINAGNPRPFVFGARDGQVRFLDASGPPFAKFNGAPFKAETVELGPGERLVVYTEGSIGTQVQNLKKGSLGKISEILAAACPTRGHLSLRLIEAACAIAGGQKAPATVIALTVGVE